MKKKITTDEAIKHFTAGKTVFVSQAPDVGRYNQVIEIYARQGENLKVRTYNDDRYYADHVGLYIDEPTTEQRLLEELDKAKKNNYVIHNINAFQGPPSKPPKPHTYYPPIEATIEVGYDETVLVITLKPNKDNSSTSK